MKFRINLLLFSLLAIFIVPVFSQSSTNNKINNDKKYFVSDLQKSIDILHYNLLLDLNTEEKILSGTAKLTAAKNLELDLEL